MTAEAVPTKISLAQKLSLFGDLFSPRTIGDLNDSQVKVVKVKGELVWHHHEREDELFLVVAGRLCIRFREGEVWLDPGELVIVPHGIEHCPYAPEETHVVLIEPATTVNTGNLTNERTAPERRL